MDGIGIELCATPPGSEYHQSVLFTINIRLLRESISIVLKYIGILNENEEFQLAEKKLDTLLSNNPFNILGLREMSYVQSKLGNKELADLYYEQFHLIIGSVLSTGDGTSYQTSWFTLSPADGQWIIKLVFSQGICFMGSGRDMNGNFHDILGIKFEDSEDCNKLYFNIQPASNRMFGPEGLKFNKTDDKIEIDADGKIILKNEKKPKIKKN